MTPALRCLMCVSVVRVRLVRVSVGAALLLGACSPAPPQPTRPPAVTPNIPAPSSVGQPPAEAAAEEARRVYATAIAIPTQPPAARTLAADVDGRLLLATTRSGPRALSDRPWDYRLAAVSRAGFTPLPLPGEDQGITDVAAAPDGRLFAIVGGRRVLRIDGPEPTDVAPRLLGVSVEQPTSYVALEWLGNESLLVHQAGAGGLFVADLRASRTRKLPGVGLEPSASPDGQQLALGYNAGEPFYSLYVTDLGFSRPRKLTADQVVEMAAAWSPDGQWIAYAANAGFTDTPTPTQAWELRVARPDGSGQRTLVPRASGITISRIAWSPDSTRLAFTRYDERAASRKVSVIPLAGGPETPVSTPDANDKVLAWVP